LVPRQEAKNLKNRGGKGLSKPGLESFNQVRFTQKGFRGGGEKVTWVVFRKTCLLVPSKFHSRRGGVETKGCQTKIYENIEEREELKLESRLDGLYKCGYEPFRGKLLEGNGFMLENVSWSHCRV